MQWYPGHKKQLGMGVQAKHASLLPSWLLLRSSFASNFIAFCFWKPEETWRDAPWRWEWGKDKSFYSEAVVLPVSLLFAAVTWGRNIRLCEIRSEAFSIGALWCLVVLYIVESTIQNRTRLVPCCACGALQSRIGHGSNSQKYEKPPPIHFQMHTATEG